MDGVLRGRFAGICMVACVTMFECRPRFDDIPCVKDSNCIAQYPYCVGGMCSATPEESVLPSDAGAGGDAGYEGDAGSAPDSGTWPGDGGRALGEPCVDARQCTEGHCANGVCCDSPCDEPGKLCQRCDNLSLSGPGHCGMAKAESECLSFENACMGRCLVSRTIYRCTGTSYACASKMESELTPVPSGLICMDDGGVRTQPAGRDAYCELGGACQNGTCEGTRWWTSCNGTGACRAAGDAFDAYKESVYAAAGASLTSACETTGSSTCDNSMQCVGDVLHATHLCDGSGMCTMPAGPGASCGKYTCDSAASRCKTQCAADVDCAQNWMCSSPFCHWNWDWVAWNVRGAGGYAVSSGVVTDNRSGLMWQQGTSDGGLPWDAGVGYCDGLNLGGYSDWRLPKLIELLSIADFTRSGPAIDTTSAFPGTPSDRFWTSTPYVGKPGWVWHVDFGDGWSSGFDMGYSAWARCVR